MKILQPNGLALSLRKEQGLVMTLMLITLLAIMVLLVTANSMAVNRLHKEVGFLQQSQIKRFDGFQTNAVAGNSRVPNLSQK
jgi:hypothetical protein